MMNTLVLVVALLSLMVSFASLLVAFYAVGLYTTAKKRLDVTEANVVALQGHRARMDGDIYQLAHALGSLCRPRLVAREPGRPQ